MTRQHRHEGPAPEDTSSPAAPSWAVVVPTIGRPSLQLVLEDLAGQLDGPRPAEVLVVDDRPLPDRDGTTPGTGAADDLVLPELPCAVRVVRSGGRGPAAARNAGWRTAAAPWVAFLDDDVRLPRDWTVHLAADLAAAGADVGGVQGRIVVPQPDHRRPTDWERSTAGLEGARWATADMAYRRAALEEVQGLDERFPLAFREDADLALRVREAGWRLVVGDRHVLHPARPAPWDVSLRVQRGGRSDALMRALHGPRWRERAQTGRGRFRWHAATVACAVAAPALLAARRPRAAALAGAGWLGLTADLALRRVLPGPRPGEDGWRTEVVRMSVTSVAIPFLAVWHRLAGEAAARRGVGPWPPATRAVLLDRDGTLVHDVPYNGEPDLVRPVARAAEVVARLRGAGLRVGLVTNQSGVGRGLLTEEQVAAVNARVEELVGRLDTVQHCPHVPADGCACRKPGPALVLRAATDLGVPPHACVVVGDIGSDVDAARAAGARSVLVPDERTLPEEVGRAELVADDLEAAADLVLAMAGGVRP